MAHSTADPKHRRRIRQPYRVLLFGVLLLTAVVLAAALGWRDTDNVRTDIGGLQQTLQSQQLLRGARDDLELAQLKFEQALDKTDHREMTTTIGEALSAYDAGTRKWNEYKDRVGSLTPNEERLRDELDDLLRQSRDLGEAIASQVLRDPDTRDQAKALLTQRDTFRNTRTAFTELDAAVTDDQIAVRIDNLSAVLGTDHRVIGLAGAAIATAVVVATILLAAQSAKRERDTEQAQADRDAVARRNALDANLQSALDMADTEDHAISVVARALSEALSDHPSQLLLADANGIFHDASGHAEMRGCQVSSPDRCPAARTGQRMVFDTPSALNACWYLQDRPEGPCSAVCAPVSVAGRAVGIIHVTGPEHLPPSEDRVAVVDLVARKVSERLATLRAYGIVSTQARTDPLTGLLNRRSLDDAGTVLDREGMPYVAAFADLDRFKQLNDNHGHQVGDQALRLFARVLRASVRPGDHVGRWGGEEFIVVLPNCPPEDAKTILERVRANLDIALAESDLPAFTVSFGAASSRPGLNFHDTIAAADVQLLEAKAAGRNRVHIEQS